MGVPERFHDQVGKREWKGSLGTTGAAEGQALHERKLLEVQGLMRTLKAAGAIAVDDLADKVAADGLDALARANVKAHAPAHDYDLARGPGSRLLYHAADNVLPCTIRLGWQLCQQGAG